MAWGATARGIGAFGAKTGWSWFAKLRFLVLGLIFGIMIMNAVLISVQQKDMGVGVKYLGTKWLLVTEQLGEHSSKIIGQEGIYDGSEGFFKGVWGVIKSLYWIIESLFVMYIWLKVLSYIALHFILWDASKTAVAYMIATMIFFAGQMITILAFTDKSMMTPFLAFYDFVRALPYIFKPVSGIVEKVMNAGGDLINGNNTI